MASLYRSWFTSAWRKLSVGQHSLSKEITGWLHQFQNLSLRWQSLEGSHWKTAGKTLICLCSTRFCMVWQLSSWMNSQRPTRCTWHCWTDTFTVMLSRIDVYKFSFLPRTVADWNVLPPSTRAKQSTDLLSRKPSTNSQTILHIIAAPCHSSSNGWPPIAGYSLKNWS